MLQRRMGESLGACSSLDVSGGDCMREQSTSALKKTPACDRGQNQMGCVGLKQREGLGRVSAV